MLGFAWALSIPRFGELLLTKLCEFPREGGRFGVKYQEGIEN